MMRLNLVHFMAQNIEEITRQDQSIFGKVCKCFLYTCLADKLFFPLKIICHNPIISLVVVLVLYLLFLIVYFPLWLSSFLVTEYGAWLIFFIAFHFLAIFIARTISFPGSSPSTIKQMSADTIRRLTEYMENTSVAAKETASAMVLIANGKLGREQFDSHLFALNQIWPAVEYFPQIKEFFEDALEQLQTSKNPLSPEETKVVQSLCRGLDECNSHFKELFQFSVSRSRDDRGNNRSGTSSFADKQNSASFSQTLLVLSARCLNSSEMVRSCAHAMRPAGGANEDDFVSSILKSLSFFTSGLSAFERLSFPYLRSILKKQHRAEIMQITGSNGNLVDGLLLRSAHDPRRKVSKTNNNDGSSSNSNAKTLVIFCCPNAGFYECISQFNFDKSWFGYYLGLGMDVFVYNYRGYGRSEGLASPIELKKDAICVLDHLRFTLKPHNIVVHGESIGGLVACHLARNGGNISALVCDRTFSSLDAAASRLMGDWAGAGLRYLALWQTDVIQDFLQAKCSKIVLQDPDDEIIADAASLRSGAACQLVFGHRCAFLAKEPKHYAVARYLQAADVPQPPPTQESAWLLQAEDPMVPLPEAFVAHFYACCKHILERGAVPSNSSNKNNSQPESEEAIVGNVLHNQLAAIELVQRKGGMADAHNNAHHQHHNNSHNHASNTPRRILVADGLVPDIEQDRVETREESTGHSSSHSTKDDDDESYAEDLEAADGAHSNSQKPKHSNSDERFNRVQGLTCRRYIERVISTSFFDSAHANDVTNSASPVVAPLPLSSVVSISQLDAHHKCWIAVSRISNNCGQFLGEAVGRGLDACRSWVATYIVWNHVELLTESQRKGDDVADFHMTSVRRAIADLEYLSQVLHASDLRGSHAVNFVLKALHVLFKRNQCSLCPSTVPLHNSGTSSFSSSLLSSLGRNVPTVSPVERSVLGQLIPLECGHNGWPEDSDMEKLSSWLSNLNLTEPFDC